MGRGFAGPVRPFVELLNICEKQSPFRVGSFGIGTHNAVEVPKDLKFSGNHWISTKNARAGEVRFETFEHDYVGSENEKGLRIIFANIISLPGSVEELPSHGKSHHLCLPTTSGHLDAVPREIVERRKTKVAKVLCIAFKKPFACSDFLELPHKNQGFNRFLLRRVIFEHQTGLKTMIRIEPMFKQYARGVRHALVSTGLPRLYSVAERGHARTRPQLGGDA